MAAGKGTRIAAAFPEQEGVPKPFLIMPDHRTMISHLLESIWEYVDDTIVIVIPGGFQPDMTDAPRAPRIVLARQEHARGTGDAFRVGLEALPSDIDRIIVLNGDGPKVPVHLIRAKAIGPSSWVAVTRRSFLPRSDAMGRYDPSAGRILERPLDPRPDDLVNTGVYILCDREICRRAVPDLPFHPEKQEYFLTDLLQVVRVDPWIIEDPSTAALFQGVNTVDEWWALGYSSSSREDS